MRHPERVYFDELKKQIVIRFREREANCHIDLAEWKGKVIEKFQEDLQEKVKGRISVRWFYDHLKSDNEDRIPRIDILNLLSEYCGFDSWEAFKDQKKVEGIKEDRLNNKPSRSKPLIFAAAGLILLLGMTALATVFLNTKKEYKICFVDSDFGIPIENKNLEITLLENGNETSTMKSDSMGCINIPIENEEFSFIVRADYYKSDTFKIKVGDKEGQDIALTVDDYGMLIHQLSVTDGDDWERRRNQLDEMISDEAVIILVTENNQGIEMYNKMEFIDRMTMPISTLKNIRILETEYKDGKISKMRITQENE